MKTKKEDRETPEMTAIDPTAAEAADELEAGGNSPEDLPVEEQVLTPELASELRAALEEMQGKAEEYLDGWQRARAEFANYKKRILRENSEIQQTARGEIIKLYLDLADDLERALREKPGSEEGQSWAEGIEIIYQKLLTRLESEGVKPMDALGMEFDPNIHEALMKAESDEYESGQIIEVMQKGYWLGDKVLRPALVRVAA